MKFLVLSDTHGSISDAEEVFKSLEGVTQIIHLGDYASDGYQLESRLGIPVITVKGNMDGSYSGNDYKIIETEYGKLYLSHGHMEAVKFSPHNLLYKAASLGCKAALYGHTHVPVYEDVGGMYLLNPGSLTRPRGGRPGSFAVIDTGDDSFTAAMLYWDRNKRTAGNGTDSDYSRRTAAGGFLRRIFNDSDGQ